MVGTEHRKPYGSQSTENPQAELGDVERGVTVSEHLEFIDWLEANPDDGVLSLRASGASEDVVNRTTVTVGEWGLADQEMGADREHTLEFGLQPELEEKLGFTEAVDRTEAVEGALAALAACINGTIQFNAIREGIAVDDITTRVRVPADLRVLFGIHDIDQAEEVFGELRIDVAVTGTDLPEEDIEKLEEFPKRSPVYNLFALAHPSTPTVSVESGDS